MAQSTAPFVLNKVSITLTEVVDGAPTGSPIEFKCQLSQAELIPSAGGGTTGDTLETFCNKYDSSGSGKSSWTLDLAGFQAWSDVQDFSVISFNSEGDEFDFVLMPIEGVVSATNPSFTGRVTMVATNVGGTANTYAKFTASLPCTEKPVMDITPVI